MQDNINDNNYDFNEFSMETLYEIPYLSVKQLTELENKLAAEYRFLSKEYVSGRLVRINKILTSLTLKINNITANNKNWVDIYNFEIETINNILTNTENLILFSNGQIKNCGNFLKTIDEYEEEVNEIFNNLQNALDFEKSDKQKNNSLSMINDFNFPFCHFFNEIHLNYTDYLQSVINNKNYQAKLIFNNIKSSSKLIWEQYFYNLINYKQFLIDKTTNDLSLLHKEYYHVNSNEMKQKMINYNNKVLLFSTNSKQNNLYNKSLNGDSKINFDSGILNFDKFSLFTNKIELSEIKKNILKSFKNFYESQNRYPNEYDSDSNNVMKKKKSSNESLAELPLKKKKYCKRTWLNNCVGLKDHEIEQDLYLLRNYQFFENNFENEASNDSDDNINSSAKKNNNFDKVSKKKNSITEEQDSHDHVNRNNKFLKKNENENFNLKYKRLLNTKKNQNMTLEFYVPEILNSSYIRSS